MINVIKSILRRKVQNCAFTSKALRWLYSELSTPEGDEN